MCTNVYATTIKDLWKKRVDKSKEKTFLIENDQHYSYQEINDLVDKKVTALQNLGIQAGDLVALQFELDLENIVTILACIKLNVIINPLNPHFDIDEIINLADNFKPFAIISQKTIRERDTISNVKEIENYQSKEVGDLKVFIRNNRTNVIANKGSVSDSPVVILNTSGTSGTPKGVVLTNKNVLSAEFGYNKAFNIKSNDMILMPSGMYHAIGFHHGLVSTIIAGSTMAIMRHYNVHTLANMITKYPVTYIDSLPTIMYDILFRISNLGNLRQLICGGDKIKAKILSKAKERHIPLYNCYGLTEAVPFSYTPAKYFVDHNCMTTAVKPIENVKVRLTKAQTVITENNIQGTIEVEGPIIFKEYLLDPKKTQEAFDGKWFNTGDSGHYNQDGLLEIDGRNSDKIIRGGENISARTVEDKVRKCQNIKDVAVLGVPDVRLGQRIGAFIVLNKKSISLTKDKLISELKANNVDKKLWPEKLWVVDTLPKTANGKVKKYILKQLAKG